MDIEYRKDKVMERLQQYFSTRWARKVKNIKMLRQKTLTSINLTFCTHKRNLRNLFWIFQTTTEICEVFCIF